MSLLFSDDVSASVAYTIAPMVDLVGTGAPRSPLWSAKRNEFVSRNPKCACCGRRTNLNVHHIKPFHLFPDLELIDDNLITLCEGGPINCHYLAGHCGAGWDAYARNVQEQIRAISSLVHILKRGVA